MRSRWTFVLLASTAGACISVRCESSDSISVRVSWDEPDKKEQPEWIVEIPAQATSEFELLKVVELAVLHVFVERQLTVS